ncbi:MAG: hypothetical protein QXQ53_05670 [Candidatus Methanosuratincola sp.]
MGTLSKKHYEYVARMLRDIGKDQMLSKDEVIYLFDSFFERYGGYGYSSSRFKLSCYSHGEKVSREPDDVRESVISLEEVES